MLSSPTVSTTWRSTVSSPSVAPKHWREQYPLARAATVTAGPQRLEVGIVVVPGADRVRFASARVRARPGQRPPRLLDGALAVVEGELGGELEPGGVGRAVVARPVVVGAGQRRRQLGVQLVVH